MHVGWGQRLHRGGRDFPAHRAHRGKALSGLATLVPLRKRVSPAPDNGTVERTEWVVRRLQPADRDLSRIVEQINSASMEIGEPFTQDSLAEFLADDRNIYLTVHADGQLAGTLHAIGYVHPAGQRYVYVDEVDVDTAFRRRGVATAMLRTACAIARRMGAHAVWLGADAGNDAANALYRSLGAQEVEPGVIYTYGIHQAHRDNRRAP